MAARRSAIALLALASFLMGLTCLSSPAQSSRPLDPVLDPLSHGRLVLWIVHNAAPPSALQQVLSARVYWPDSVQEQTAGSFGTASSNVGVNAGSYGQPASTLGTNASNVGTNASNYGRSASDVGTAASNTGTNASNYGQTAGSFGQTAGSFGQSLSTINNVSASTEQATSNAYHHPPHDWRWTSWLMELHERFPDLQVTVVDVRDDELKQQLDAAAGTNDQPDVVLGDPLPPIWSRSGTGLLWQYGLATLGSHAWLQQTELAPGADAWRPQVSILRAAPDLNAARALVLWSLGIAGCTTCPSPVAVVSGSAADAAQAALTGLLRGDGIGNPDPDMARFNLQAARAEALNAYPAPDPLAVRVDVMRSESNDRLAVVEMRAIVAGPQSFGAANALAVLRKGADGRWLVLHLTPNLPFTQVNQAYSMLAGSAHAAAPAHVAGISLAAPVDGDNRGPQPELWWDNPGGASLQVIEWQVKNGDRSSVSHLFFVPDRDPHLRTRVTATFATLPAAYRWRIWSVGSGGVLVLSPWRTLNIVR